MTYSSSASGLTQTLLFSVAPYIIEILANIEGTATSEGKAENKALIYFWYFFIVARFIGQIALDTMVGVVTGCKYKLFCQ